MAESYYEDSEERLNRLLDQQDARIATIFRTAVSNLKDEIDVDQLADLIEQGRLNDAIERLGDAAEQLSAASNVAFVTTGQSTADFLRSAGVARIVFNQININAVAAMQANRLELIREFTAEQRRATSTALVTGVEAGTNPIAQARNFRDSIGLTQTQWTHVASYRAALERVGVDPDAAQDALGRQLRDGRGDKSILAAARANRKLAPDRIDWLVSRYADRYVQYRAKVIGRTEALRAVHQGNEEGYRQAIEAGDIRADQIRRTWRTRLDGRERRTHMMLNGQEVGWGEAWVTENGMLRYPGDPDAPASETIQCFPAGVILSTAGVHRVITRHYSGELVQLIDGSGVDLPVTPNHPILTQRGWVAAGEIVEGDYLVNCTLADGRSAAQPDIEHGYALASDLASLAKLTGHVDRPKSAAVNLHGEVPQHQVEIITPPSELRDRWQALGRQFFGESDLLNSDIGQGSLLYERLLCQRLGTANAVQRAIISGFRKGLSLVGRHLGHANSVRFAHGADRQPKINEASVDPLSAYADFLGDGAGGKSSVVKIGDLAVKGTPLYSRSRVLRVERSWHDGPVYTLETDNGIMIANGKVAHNCRCAVLTRIRQV